MILRECPGERSQVVGHIYDLCSYVMGMEGVLLTGHRTLSPDTTVSRYG